MFYKNFIKYASGCILIGANLFFNQAFAISNCTSIANYDELVSTGACLTGPENRIVFTNFNTSVPRELWKSIKITTTDNPAAAPIEGGEVGVYSLTFNTTDVGIPGISFSFDAVCDGSCLMNDGVYSLGSNAGTGIWVINGQQQPFENSNLYTPIFSPYVRTLHQYAAYTQTAIPGLSPNTFSFGVNIVPTNESGHHDGTCN